MSRDLPTAAVGSGASSAIALTVTLTYPEVDRPGGWEPSHLLVWDVQRVLAAAYSYPAVRVEAACPSGNTDCTTDCGRCKGGSVIAYGSPASADSGTPDIECERLVDRICNACLCNEGVPGYRSGCRYTSAREGAS